MTECRKRFTIDVFSLRSGNKRAFENLEHNFWAKKNIWLSGFLFKKGAPSFLPLRIHYFQIRKFFIFRTLDDRLKKWNFYFSRKQKKVMPNGLKHHTTSLRHY